MNIKCASLNNVIKTTLFSLQLFADGRNNNLTLGGGSVVEHPNYTVGLVNTGESISFLKQNLRVFIIENIKGL